MSKNKRYINALNRKQEEFLIRHYQKEWELAERNFKKHELAQKAKQVALTSGQLALTALLAGGALTLALVAPKVFVAFHKMSGSRRFFQEEDLDKKIQIFNSRSYFRYQKVSDQEYEIALTRKGRKLAQRFALQNFKLHKERVWDKKWRMITFDIDRKNGAARDALRFKLRSIGALPIQDSVFIFPYHCYEEITFWASFYCIEKCVYYAEVTHIFNEHHSIEKQLKSDFGLL